MTLTHEIARHQTELPRAVAVGVATLFRAIGLRAETGNRTQPVDPNLMLRGVDLRMVYPFMVGATELRQDYVWAFLF